MRKFLSHEKFLFMLLLVAANATNAQNIITGLSKYVAEYQPERLYIHYDKTAYVPGETIWFKVYLMSDIYVADKSRTVYTDWVDDMV